MSNNSKTYDKTYIEGSRSTFGREEFMSNDETHDDEKTNWRQNASGDSRSGSGNNGNDVNNGSDSRSGSDSGSSNGKPVNLIKELRAVLPTRPLTVSESYTLAERQANRALSLLGIVQPHVGLSWIVDLPRVEVQVSPRFKMDGFSGVTTFAHGRYLVLVNKNDGHARRRFTLAHEFKHLLDYTAAAVIHRSLGYGDPGRQGQRVEAVCNHFAACLLMPRAWVIREWTAGLQDVTVLAGSFHVSEEAMDKRLRFLGLLDDDTRPLRTYFRRDAGLHLSDLSNFGVAA